MWQETITNEIERECKTHGHMAIWGKMSNGKFYPRCIQGRLDKVNTCVPEDRVRKIVTKKWIGGELDGR